MSSMKVVFKIEKLPKGGGGVKYVPADGQPKDINAVYVSQAALRKLAEGEAEGGFEVPSHGYPAYITMFVEPGIQE